MIRTGADRVRNIGIPKRIGREHRCEESFSLNDISEKSEKVAPVIEILCSHPWYVKKIASGDGPK
jgi:hypothetical protein